MEFTSSNYQDIDRYFQGTYVKFDEFGDRLFFIEQVTPTAVHGRDEDGTVFELALDNSIPYSVNYILPHKAVFQYKDNAHIMQRIPARQYRRGLCSNNCQVVNLGTGSKVELTFSLLKAFVTKQQYFSFHKAFNAKGKLKTVALSSRMSFLRPTGGIFVDMTQVATFDYETKKITMLYKEFLPEIMQHMVDHNDTYEVLQ